MSEVNGSAVSQEAVQELDREMREYDKEAGKIELTQVAGWISDLIMNDDRVNLHCSNQAMIQLEKVGFGPNHIHSDRPEYREEVESLYYSLINEEMSNQTALAIASWKLFRD